MRRALRISAGLHAALIAASLIQLPWIVEDEEEVITSAEVSILTEDEFNAAISQAPEIVPTDIGNMMSMPLDEFEDALTPDAEMDVTINDVEGPDDPSEADAQADLTALLVEDQIRVETETTALNDTLDGDVDTAVLMPTARPTPSRPSSMSRPTGMVRPQAPSLRIDSTPAAPPPEDARRDDERQEEIELSENGELDELPQEATAPEEAADRVIPELPDELAETGTDAEEEGEIAPVASVRPRARPARREPVEEEPLEVAETPIEDPLPEPEPEPASEPEPEPEPTPAPTPAEETPAETEQPATPQVAQGPPIPSGPINLVRQGVGDRWNISFQGIENWQSFRVTVRFELTPDGQLSGEPRAIVPQNLEGGFGVAFNAAVRAIKRAAQEGVFAVLPRESYGRWQVIEMTFDPSSQSVGFGS
ncbi:hypothetical protein [Roseobacter sp. HKCCA0434]|uniref:hypothetical protein n=1 Tax=Roseobacter sp. HKCCA0434 TaxID=3079297 RepID=UPI002905D7F6|nr:hypothetical protein [Roseobacter sp. HKCCA0434]